MDFQIPKRAWPPIDGVKAFDADGEALIYDAVKVHGIHPTKVAAESGCSLPTVYTIVKKEKARRTAIHPGCDQGRETTTGPTNGDSSTPPLVSQCATASLR